jgi:demethylmenaquinone methyltransferase/2-methoxy-6-polyprenyl-1,4-benzoquinol methylase
MKKYYPKSKVEIKGFIARYYDRLMDIMTFGRYGLFIKEAVQLMEIKPLDRILDLGAGSGRNAYLMMKYLSSEGQLIGIDISKEMILEFKKKCAGFANAKIVYARADQSLPFKESFDKVFISFVFHGFPQAVRETIMDNVSKALKKDGKFYILDWNEFDLRSLPFYQRTLFKLVECPHAFDFVHRDWKEMLIKHDFDDFREHFFFQNFVRLLEAKKLTKK